MDLRRTLVLVVSLSLFVRLHAQERGKAPVIHDGQKGFVFGFLGWEKAKTAFAVQTDGIHITAKDGKGGGGLVAGGKLSLTDYAEWSPALVLSVGKNNKAQALNLLLQDADGTGGKFKYDLSRLKPDESHTVLPEHGASLAEPGEFEKPGKTPGLDLANIAGVMIIGDWGTEPVEVVLSKIALTPPTEELRGQRAALRERRAKAAEKAREEAAAKEQARQKLLAQGAPHPVDGPDVKQICAVAPDVLAVTIQAGQHVNNQLVPYVAQPGDELVEQKKDKPLLDVRDGKVVEYYPRAVLRGAGKKPEKVGQLSPDGAWLFIDGKSKGQPLDESVVDMPEAYAIQSDDDAAYARPVAPAQVFRKGKPNGFSQPLPFLYTISLRLPTPLKEGATYTVRFVGVNTARETVTYAHRPREVRSIAVHAIQTGYRPDDQYKRAYLSFWMGVDSHGKDGSCTPDGERFELLDGAGKTVFTGKAELAKTDGAVEQISIHEKVDYTKAAVRRLDFSVFNTPGEYRVFVPGVGVSGLFRIAADVWEKPFKAAMQGILSQRQAIDLGPPMCAFTRKRAFHPADGVQFYQIDVPYQAGQEGTRGERLSELSKVGPLERVTLVPGGYQDAGDWDTLGGHLSATYDLLGLYALNPAAFARVKLSLPAAEMKNNLPDILDEALWQMPLWRSLQLPDGSVRGGYGDGWGCHHGETSSMRKYAAVYAVDHETTLRYAAAAARAAHVLAAFDKQLAAEYLESAKRAWTWVEAHSRAEDATYQKVLSFDKKLAKDLRNFRAMAAVELLAATRDPAFDAAFKQSSELAQKNGPRYLEQLGADFAYARLPDGLGDAALKKIAVDRIAAYADHAVAFSRHNAYDIITGHRTDMPMIFVSRYFSTPGAGGMALIYAYELTRKPHYLAAAVQGSNYCLGANPDNLSYCTGVGDNAQHFNFIVDAHVTGQLPDVMVGHIPYGQGNEGNEMSRRANSWVQQWLLNFGPAKKMHPNWFDWPVNEQYIDFAKYPLHNENCFNQTTVPAACYWFYLAHR